MSQWLDNTHQQHESQNVKRQFYRFGKKVINGINTCTMQQKSFLYSIPFVVDEYTSIVLTVSDSVATLLLQKVLNLMAKNTRFTKNNTRLQSID